MANKADLFQVEGQHTGLLVAVWLDPQLASRLAIPGGEAPEQLHLTLCYCGDANAMTDVQIGRAISAAAEAGMMYEPLTGQIAGVGRFNASESSGDQDVLYANVDVPGLEKLRQFLATSLEMAGCPPLDNHGYTPHITLSYLEGGADWPLQRLPTLPFDIRSIWVGVGDRRTEIPLTGTSYKGVGQLGGTAQSNVAGNALKAVSKTDDELRVANYMVLFGGRDLEGITTPRRNPDGSRGEFFTKNTQFDSPYTDLGFLYVDWEHGVGQSGEPGRDEPLGYVDWKSARIDEKGLFVERVLNRRNKYVRYVEDLFEKGIFGASSEAIVERVQSKANGEIITWPLRRDTITVSPMDPRQLSENTLSRIKALSERIPALNAIVARATGHDAVWAAQLATPEGTPEADGTSAAQPARKGNAIDPNALALELELLQLD